MPPNLTHLRVILLGGSSHAGKSTVAQTLAAQLGWTCLSTDKLAKHPGRPWRAAPKAVPGHVATHYLTLTPPQLIEDVMRHYERTVWPMVETLVTAHASGAAPERLVLEGSAILPHRVAANAWDCVGAVWLTGGDELFAQRIRDASAYAHRSATERQMIDAFLERTLRFNALTTAAVRQHGLSAVEVRPGVQVEETAATCLAVLAQQDARCVRGVAAREGKSTSSHAPEICVPSRPK